MKYLHSFENYEMTKREQTLSNAVTYLEELMPIKEEDGLREMVYSDEHDTLGVIISIYFDCLTSEESFEKVYDFLKINKLPIYKEHYYKDVIEFMIKISEYKINKYSELYNSTQKYNI